MRTRSGAKSSRSGNDCAEEDQRETEHEALIGFDVVDPSDQMYEPTVYMSRCVASAAGLNPSGLAPRELRHPAPRGDR